MSGPLPEPIGYAAEELRGQLKRHVYARSAEAFAAGDRARDELATIEQLASRQAFMRHAVIERLGGLPPSDTPLRQQVVKTLETAHYRMEAVVFESRPGVYVTSSLYIPSDLKERTGAVLFVCGHFDEGRLAPDYQTVCQLLARAGLLVLAIDPIGQGERSSYVGEANHSVQAKPGTAEHDYAGAQCLPVGDGLARYFVHDIVRAIDYLITRPEVDPTRIGITGNSGGGTQTSLAMLCDPRIAAAAPGTFITSREAIMLTGQAQDAEQIWRGMSAVGFDHEDILLAFAPKPLLVMAAEHDFFPIAGTRRTCERASRFWKMTGAADRFELFVDDCDHRYSVPMARRAAAFFAKHLLHGAAQRPAAEWGESELRTYEAQQLQCTASGQAMAEYTGARAVFEDNLDRLQACRTQRERIDDAERRKRAFVWLEQVVLTGRKPVPFATARLLQTDEDELSIKGWLWRSQYDLHSYALSFEHAEAAIPGGPITIAIWPDGTQAWRERLSWIRSRCARGERILVLDLDGMGVLTPDKINGRETRERYGTLHRLTTDLLWLDDSLAALRTYEVWRAIEWARQQFAESPAAGICLYAEEHMTLYALMAVALTAEESGHGSIRVTVPENCLDIAEWVGRKAYDPQDVMEKIVPGMLRYFDQSDLIRWTNAERVDRVLNMESQ